MTSSTVEFTRSTPWLFELAAKLENEQVEDLYRDAGTIARSLTGVANLFGLPAVCVPIDTMLEAEAVGCGIDQDTFGTDVGEVDGIIETVDDAFDVDITGIVEGGRVPTMLDAAERLAETCDATVLGGVTGPGLLTKHLCRSRRGTIRRSRGSGIHCGRTRRRTRWRISRRRCRWNRTA